MFTDSSAVVLWAIVPPMGYLSRSVSSIALEKLQYFSLMQPGF